MISRHTALAALFLVIGCSSSTLRTDLTPITVAIAPLTENSVPEVRGYHLTQLDHLLPETIAADFSSTVGQATFTDAIPSEPGAPVLNVAIVPDFFSQALQLTDPLRESPHQIVWFRLDYRIATPAGETIRGSIPAYGPEPRNFGSVEVEQRTFVKNAVVQLRRAVLSARSRT